MVEQSRWNSHGGQVIVEQSWNIHGGAVIIEQSWGNSHNGTVMVR